MLQVTIDVDKGGYQIYGPAPEFVEVKIPPIPRHLTRDQAQRAIFLTIARAMCERQRKFVAWDHEHHRRGKGITWQGAAIAVTNKGLYIISNLHLCNDDAARNCAENLSMTIARSDLGPDVKISEVIFTGGPAQPFVLPYEFSIPAYMGRYYSPCGSCRDVINNFGLQDGATIVTMIPHGTTDDNFILPHNGETRHELADNQAFSLPIKKLLPQLHALVSDPTDFLKESILAGWGFIQGPMDVQNFDVFRETRDLWDIEVQAGPASALKHVNVTAMRWMNALYHASDKDVESSDAAFIRLTNGHWYFNANYVDHITSSTHPAVDNVISTMRAAPEPRGRITDVFGVHFDIEHFMRLENHYRKGARVPVKLLDGNGRERTKKICVDDGVQSLFGKTLSHNNAIIHQIIPNGIDDFAPDVHLVTKQLRNLLPNGYQNPKGQRALSHAATAG